MDKVKLIYGATQINRFCGTSLFLNFHFGNLDITSMLLFGFYSRNAFSWIVQENHKLNHDLNPCHICGRSVSVFLFVRKSRGAFIVRKIITGHIKMCSLSESANRKEYVAQKSWYIFVFLNIKVSRVYRADMKQKRVQNRCLSYLRRIIIDNCSSKTP